eukprot:6191691-Pleurochrysis_carterae.AAC.1
MVFHTVKGLRVMVFPKFESAICEAAAAFLAFTSFLTQLSVCRWASLRIGVLSLTRCCDSSICCSQGGRRLQLASRPKTSDLLEGGCCLPHAGGLAAAEAAPLPRDREAADGSGDDRGVLARRCDAAIRAEAVPVHRGVRARCEAGALACDVPEACTHVVE